MMVVVVMMMIMVVRERQAQKATVEKEETNKMSNSQSKVSKGTIFQGDILSLISKSPFYLNPPLSFF